MPQAIHESALVSPRAEVPDDVVIGPFSIVHDDVRLGPGCRIGSHCVLGEPTPLAEGVLDIGAGAVVRSHSVFYRGSTIGPGLNTGHRVTVREGVTAGAGLQLGTLCDLQGDVVIGEHTRCHSNVHIGKESRIGSFVWIFPYVVLTNDATPPTAGPYVGPTVEDFAVLATMSVVLPGVRIGTGALVGAHSSVTRDVEPDRIVVGVPAKDVGPTSRLKLPDGSPAYPWRRHFHRGYPEELVATWVREVGAAQG